MEYTGNKFTRKYVGGIRWMLDRMQWNPFGTRPSSPDSSEPDRRCRSEHITAGGSSSFTCWDKNITENAILQETGDDMTKFHSLYEPLHSALQYFNLSPRRAQKVIQLRWRNKY